jgi:hypothetical protein
MARCIDCAHESGIDWNQGITELSGYCQKGDQSIGKHLNKKGVNQSLHAQRKCAAFQPKTKPDQTQKEASTR